MGDENYEVKTYKEIYDEMQALIFGDTVKATDGNEGSVLSSLLEATARVIHECYLHCKIGYSTYLEALPEGAFGLKRLEGTRARGKLVFYCEEIEDEQKHKTYRKADNYIYIPKGTEVASGSLVFVTIKEGSIEKGSGESEPILAEAKEIGESYNVPSGAITTILTGLSNRITGVKNIRPFENGRGVESDISFRKRFIHYLKGLQRTNKDGILQAAYKAGAYHVDVRNYAPPKEIKIDEENGTYEVIGELKNGDIENNRLYLANCVVYVCNKEGKCSAQLLKDVREMLEGSEDESGYTPCGVQIAVLPIVAVRCFHGTGFKLLINVKSVLENRDETIKGVRNCVLEFFRNFETGQSLVVTDLIVAIRALNYIKDVQIKSERDGANEFIPIKIKDGQLMVVEPEDIKIDFIKQ